ncbi:MAG: hypothetical protein ACPG4T_02180, partial [Nannocystaceae bacterium]
MTAPSLALLWMVWAGPLYPAEVGEAAKGILAADTFAFCHEADFPLTDDEAKWCPVLASDSSRCPAMVDACKALRAELDYPAGGRQATSRRTIEGEGGVKGEGGGKGGGEKMRDDDEPCIEG